MNPIDFDPGRLVSESLKITDSLMDKSKNIKSQHLEPNEQLRKSDELSKLFTDYTAFITEVLQYSRDFYAKESSGVPHDSVVKSFQSLGQSLNERKANLENRVRQL